MNSKQIADFIGRRLWLRRVIYFFIRLTTLREWYLRNAIDRVIARYGQTPIRVLDAGSGMGQHSFDIARKPSSRVIGIETDAQQVEDCREASDKFGLSSVSFYKGDVMHLDLDMQFHMILCSSVLEHLNDDRKALNGFARLLEPGGTLIVYVPASEQRVLSFLNRKIAHQVRNENAKYPHGHVRYYSAPDLQNKLESTGLTLVETRITYGPYGRLAYDIVTSVQYQPLFIWIFPFYFLFVHPFVMLLMWADMHHRKTSGNGLMMLAVKHA